MRQERNINWYERVFVIKLCNNLNCIPGLGEVRSGSMCLQRQKTYITVQCDIVAFSMRTIEHGKNPVEITILPFFRQQGLWQGPKF